MGKLSAAKVKSLSKPGFHGDGGTLYLRIAPGGSKQWMQRIVIGGKRRDLGLGPWPVVSLAEARDKAFDNRRSVYQGHDPLAEKRREKTPTFAEAAEKFHAANKAKWRSDKHAKNWMQIMSKYALPAIGGMEVDEIDRESVLRFLAPLWGSKPETAKRLRRFVRSVFAWAMAHGYREDDPAGEGISGALPKLPKVAAHFKALPYREVGEAVKIVEASGASMAVKLAFRFLVLTAARSGEIRNAAWAEIDLDSRTWKIPGSKMKSGKEHRVALSDEALATLEKAREFSDGSDLIFPSPVRRGQPMSDMTMTKIMRNTGLADRATIHGMRSSFRDWCAERGVDREVAEAALAHSVGGVEGAYFRSDLFERRARMMEQWGRFVCGGERGKVVEIRSA